MKKKIGFIQILAIMAMLIGCHTNVIDETGNNNNEVRNVVIRGSVSIDEKELSVQTIMGASRLDGGNFEVPSISNEMPHLLFVDDDNGNTILMARDYYSSEEHINIDAQSTAIALITLHPLFVPISGYDFQELVSLITNSSNYQEFYNVVATSIANRQNIFDSNNVELLLATNNLLEDICGSNNVTTRSYISNWELLNINNPYPFLIKVDNDIMSVTNIALSPRYDGTISHPILGIQELEIPSRNGYGGWELIKQAAYGWSSGTIGDLANGEPVKFKFTEEGEYKFHFVRNEWDYYWRVIKDVLLEFGLPKAQEAFLDKYINDIAGIAQMNGMLAVAPGTDPVDAIHGLVDVTVTYFLNIKGTPEGAKFYEKFPNAEENLKKGANILKFYKLIKGTSNALLRLGWRMKAPEYVDFCLCYYGGEVSSCTQRNLIPVRHTNNQEGFSNQRLLLPIQVLAMPIAEDGTNIESNYQKVKFEVISGGGSISETIVDTNEEGFAETYWTLGEKGEQKVRAVVIDIVTGEEVSNEGIFSAKIKEDADLTIRLDWHKLSGDTDIDLHVTDPYGEEIAYYSPYSASGGWLDRDDVVGPGPEHISWTKAPAGVYLVQVHYYDSESKAVTSYNVTINTNGQTYGPYKGSIGYDQMVTIGTITMPEGSVLTRSTPVFTPIMETQQNKKVYPPKK